MRGNFRENLEFSIFFYWMKFKKTKFSTEVIVIALITSPFILKWKG